MRLQIPVLVHHDPHERYHVHLPPPWSGTRFQSRSLAEALDDAALHVMEKLPKASAAQVEALLVRAPNLSHRRVRVTAQLPVNERRTEEWTGRLSVWTERWPKDSVHLVTLPRLGGHTLPVMGLSDLPEALAAFLAKNWVAGQAHVLDAATCQPDEHLHILDVDAELPTVLPSRIPRRRSKKRKDKTKDKDKPAKKVHVPPTTLRSVGRNLAHAAIDGRLLPAFGRDGLIDTLMTELARPGAAVLLVGSSGVGKTALVHEVVRRLVDKDAPLTERTDVWEVDGNRIVAGMSYVGQWESRVEDMVHELTARDDILYVDDLPTLVYTGRSAQSDMHVAAFLEPHLAHGELRLVGETTPERLAACREEAPGFFNRFRLVHVDELPERETLMVLLRAMRALEARRQLTLRPDSLRAVQGLSRRFHARECEPGASVRLLRGLADLLTSERTDDADRAIIDAPRVASAYQSLTGLPSFLLDPDASKPPDEIREWFAHRIIGQDTAIDAATATVCTLQQGLDDPNRPVATMLLVGPTGVGKTETAKTLARWLFGSADRMIRFDMSEIRDTASLARLVGDVRQPDGELTRRVGSEPFSVVLFDEIEKAHPAVFDLLLQVMGEGRLTNAAGQTADFTNTLVLLTSNLGVAESGKSVGFGNSRASSQDLHFAKAAQAFFRPEFFNRIDRVVPYRALEREHVALLASRLLGTLSERRGLRASSVLVRVSPEVVDVLVAEGYDPMYGARALKRTLERRLTVPLARLLATTPVAHTAFLDLYPVGEDIEIELHDLQIPEHTRAIDTISEDWAELQAFAAELRASLVALESTAPWSAARARRTQLIADVQRPEGGDHDALAAVTDLLSRARRIRDELDRLDEECFARFTFEDRWDTDTDYDRWSRKTTLQPAWEVQETDQSQLLGEIRSTLVNLRQQFVQTAWLASKVDEPIEALIVRVLPETGEARTHQTVLRATQEVHRLWGAWGRVERVVRVDGVWAVGTKDSKPDAFALQVFAPGAQALAERLQGYIMATEILGPDHVTTLARVEVLLGDDAPATLQHAETDWANWTDQRRAGTVTTPSPRPALPVLVHHGSETPTRLLDLAVAAMQEDLP